jgi:protocatechuate 3,4-dioxygenase, alpha subunit
MDLVPTPSQTIGPFFHLGLTAKGPGAKGERIRLACRVLDGDGEAVDDAMLEIWQADADGIYRSSGFGRLFTNEDGACVFETVKPGQVPGPDRTMQAPHVNVLIFARGLLKQLVTRVYFAGEPSNQNDPILALVPEERRDTLMAQPHAEDPGVWNFEIRLANECETVFFDV